MASRDFGILLGLAYQAFVDRLHEHLAACGFANLGSTTGYVVRAIEASPRITQRALAERLGITEQRAGQIVDELVATKFLVRVRDPDDARARLLELGPRGTKLLVIAKRFHADFERRLAHQLGTSVATTRRVLEHIVATSSDDTAAGRLRAT
jgi:DNA-binding MarR family transcriptional regulator